MVGTGDPSPFQTPRTFIAHWDGTRLHRVQAGEAGAGQGDRAEPSITAVAPDDVWAVGAHGRHGQTYLPLVEHFDGTSLDRRGRPTRHRARPSDLIGVDAVVGD